MDHQIEGLTFRGTRFFVLINDPQREEFWQRMATGKWESSTFDVFDKFLTAETVACDIGAWIGSTALYMASRASRVIALAPDPQAYRELQSNLALNDFARNVQAIQACLSTATGTERLIVASSPGDSMSSIVGPSAGQGWDVRAIILVELIADLPPDAPIFLKVDVEGY